jgi:hypothetical protein
MSEKADLPGRVRSPFHAECKNGEIERLGIWGGIKNISVSV